MSYVVKKLSPCRECGVSTNRRERNTREPLCLHCAIDKARANLVQLTQHQGPHYENWLNAMRQRFGDKSTGTPTPYKMQDRAPDQ